jgi:hypothetical protein
MKSNKNQTNHEINLDTFYLTSFLLNYDIGPKVYSGDDIISITNRLLKLIVLNDKYPFELISIFYNFKFNKFYSILIKSNLKNYHVYINIINGANCK